LLLITWITSVKKSGEIVGQSGSVRIVLAPTLQGLRRATLVRPAALCRRGTPGPGRRGSLPPTGPCVAGPPSSNRLLGPLPLLHVFTPAAPATQRQRTYARRATPRRLLAVAPHHRLAVPCLDVRDGRDPFAKAHCL
jgi:hypothetical protein